MCATALTPETQANRLREELAELTTRLELLSRHLKGLALNCCYRRLGICHADCPHREVCNPQGLLPFRLTTL